MAFAGAHGETMTNLARLILWLIGYRAVKGINANNQHYEAWVKRGSKVSLFHVYEEQVKGVVVRPKFKKRKTK